VTAIRPTKPILMRGPGRFVAVLIGVTPFSVPT
jgi:hypothetical protein